MESSEGITIIISRFKEKRIPSPSPDVYRIITYGDSVTMGYGLEMNETWPFFLEQKLKNKTKLPVEVLNYGGNGNSPVQYAVHMPLHLKSLKPNLVILEVEWLNDLADDASYWWMLFDQNGLPWLHSGGRYKSLFESESLFLSNVGFSGMWFERTILYTLLSRAVGRYLGAHAHLSKKIDGLDYYFFSLDYDEFLINEKSIEANLQGTFKILKSLGELAKQNQTEFLLHLVPAKFVYEKNSPYSAYSDKIFQKSVQLAKITHLNTSRPMKNLNKVETRIITISAIPT